jgi:hypothetical protein
VLGTTFASIFAANAQSPGFKLTNNILAFGVIGGDSTAPGDPAIAMYFPDSEVLRNALIGVGEKAVPAMNFLAVDLADVGFIDPVTGDFRLSPSAASTTRPPTEPTSASISWLSCRRCSGSTFRRVR